jgi:hypothetical protein
VIPETTGSSSIEIDRFDGAGLLVGAGFGGLVAAAVGVGLCAGNDVAIGAAEGTGVGISVGVGAQALTSNAISSSHLKRMIFTPTPIYALKLYQT